MPPPPAAPRVAPLTPAPTPLDLPRLLMRRAGLLGAAVLALALVLGLARTGHDIGEEVDAAVALAAVMARLGTLGSDTDDARALEALRAVQAAHPLRHLALTVRAADGTVLLAPPAAPPAPAPLHWLLTLHRAWQGGPDTRAVRWAVARPATGPWTVELAATRESERREALGSLLGMLALLGGGVVGLLLVMQWNLRRALAPLGRLLEAIAGIEGRQGLAGHQVQALPAMPIRELESLAAALRHLGTALDAAEARRRQLAQQVLTLQDDERARLARELHDEFGQRLTALRVDAAWLSRRLDSDAALQPVAEGMAQQCALVLQDIRQLLARLQPFGPASPGAPETESLARGTALLRALVDSWQGSGRGLDCGLALAWADADGRARPWPDEAAAQALCLPRPLWLTLYRISQEALTNTARHADAGRAGLRLTLHGAAGPDAPLRLDWQAWDDGRGLPDAGAALPRGNGLAGLQERVWAQGGTLQCSAAQPGAARPGLLLSASFHSRWLPPPDAG